jgi:hypothetical protein
LLTIIIAAIGAAVGIAGAIKGRYDAANEYGNQADQLAKEKQRALDLEDLEFDTAKEQADKNADTADWQTTLQETYVGTGTNNTVAALGDSEKARALGENVSAMSTDRNTGAELSQQAASGTRSGGSASLATAMEEAVAEKQLQMQEDQSRNSDAYALSSALASFNEDTGNIKENRRSALDLRESYEDGGSQNSLYKAQRANTEAGYNDKIDYYNDKKESTNQWYNYMLDIVTAGATGASAGYSAGSSISNYAADSAKYNTAVSTFNTNSEYSSTYGAFGNTDNLFGRSGFANSAAKSQNSYMFGLSDWKK